LRENSNNKEKVLIITSGKNSNNDILETIERNLEIKSKEHLMKKKSLEKREIFSFNSKENKHHKNQGNLKVN
jgi:hypothetical protein